MSKFVTKNVKVSVVDVKVYSMEEKKPVMIDMTISGKVEPEKIAKKINKGGKYRFLKITDWYEVDNMRRMPVGQFMHYATVLNDGDSKAGMVTRTIGDTYTTILMYNENTEEMEEREFHALIVNLDKVECDGYIACEILKRREEKITYGMPIETFLAHSEPAK